MKLYNILTALTSYHIHKVDQGYEDVCLALGFRANNTDNARRKLILSVSGLEELYKRSIKEKQLQTHAWVLTPSLERAFCELYQVDSLDSEVSSPFPPPAKAGFDRIKFLRW